MCVGKAKCKINRCFGPQNHKTSEHPSHAFSNIRKIIGHFHLLMELWLISKVLTYYVIQKGPSINQGYFQAYYWFWVAFNTSKKIKIMNLHKNAILFNCKIMKWDRPVINHVDIWVRRDQIAKWPFYYIMSKPYFRREEKGQKYSKSDHVIYGQPRTVNHRSSKL